MYLTEHRAGGSRADIAAAAVKTFKAHEQARTEVQSLEELTQVGNTGAQGTGRY